MLFLHLNFLLLFSFFLWTVMLCSKDPIFTFHLSLSLSLSLLLNSLSLSPSRLLISLSLFLFLTIHFSLFLSQLSLNWDVKRSKTKKSFFLDFFSLFFCLRCHKNILSFCFTLPRHLHPFYIFVLTAMSLFLFLTFKQLRNERNKIFLFYNILERFLF